MADDRMKISALDSASTMDTGDLFPVTQDRGGSLKTNKATMSQVATEIVHGIEYETYLADFPQGKRNPTDALNELRNMVTGQFPIKTVSGAIANFSTSLELPLVACKAQIVPKQASGTPTPSSPLPISGTNEFVITHTGKNLLDVLTESITLGNITLTQADNGIQISGSESSAKNTYLFNGHLPAGDYVVFDSVQGSNSTHQIVINNAGTTLYVTTAQKTFTVSSYEDVVSIRLYIYSGNTDTLIKPQLEVGSTASNYERPKQNTFTKELPRIIYGGEVDVVSGSGTETDGIVDLGSLTWTLFDAQDGVTRFLAQVNGMKEQPVRTMDIYCSCFVCNKTAQAYLDNGIYNVNNRDQIIVATSLYNDKDTFKTAMSGMKATFKLVTPTPITTTPTEIKSQGGTNNIYSDTGDVEVKYRLGIQEYIDEQIANVQALIL